MPARKVFEGNIYPTTKGGNVIVLNYVRDTHILVEFMDDDKYQTVVGVTALLKGLIHNPYARTFYGRGYMGVGRFSTNPKLDTYKVYKAWQGMMSRCYSEEEKLRHPSMELSHCCPEWFNLQVFGEWYISQKGWDQPKWQLDKDLMGNGSRLYSPETCVILPPVINTSIRFINLGSVNNNGLPHGVHYAKQCRKYITDCRTHGDDNKPKTMYFKTAQEAFNWFKEKKEVFLKCLAFEFKDRIEERAFNKLLSLEIPSPF